MDIYTERGQEFEARVREMISNLERKFPGWQFFSTPTPFGERVTRHEVGGHVDGVAMSMGEMKYIYEVKTRTQLIADFERWGSFIVSHSKIINGARISEILKTPFYILFNLFEENAVFSFQITDSTGAVVAEYSTEIRETQKNVNGGRKKEMVAKLPFHKGKQIYFER